MNEDVKHDICGNYNKNNKETHRSSTLVEPATNKSAATVHQSEHQVDVRTTGIAVDEDPEHKEVPEAPIQIVTLEMIHNAKYSTYL